MMKVVLPLLVLVTLARSDDDYDDDYTYEEYDDTVGPVEEDSHLDFSSQEVNILSESRTITVPAGTTFNLPCQVDKLPQILYQNILWERSNKAGTIISTGKRVIAGRYKNRASIQVNEQGSQLKVILAEEADAGLYKCRITTGKKDLASVTHKVNIGREAYQFNISEGEELVLTCNATNQRPVAWHYTAGGTAREVPGEELRIPSVAQRHAGDYRCKAEAGVEKHVVVTVLFPPKIHVAEMVMTSIMGEVAELVCTVRGVPTPSVQWRRNGAEVLPDTRKSVSWKGERNTLTIVELSQEDLDNYTCTAVNSQGRAEESIQLTAPVSSASGQIAGVPLIFVVLLVLNRA